MADEQSQPIEIPEQVRDYAHRQATEAIILTALLGITTSLSELLLVQKKRNMDAVEDLIIQHQVIRAKLVLLGYADKDSVRFVP